MCLCYEYDLKGTMYLWYFDFRHIQVVQESMTKKKYSGSDLKIVTAMVCCYFCLAFPYFCIF